MPRQARLSQLSQPDLIGSYQAGQAIRGNNIRLDEAEKEIDTQNYLSKLRGQAASGGNDALKEMQRVKPSSVQEFAASVDSIAAMEDNKKQRKINEAKHLFGFYSSSPTKELHDRNRGYIINAAGIDPGEWEGDDKHKFNFKFSAMLNNKANNSGKLYKVVGDDGNVTYQPFEGAVGQGAPNSGQTINVGGNELTPDQEIQLAAKKKGAEKTAEFEAKSFQTLMDSADKEAQAASQTISLIRAQNAIGADTGPGAGLADMSRRVTVALGSFVGVPESALSDQLSKITDIGQFRAIQEKMVGSKLAAEPGVKTDGDAERMRNTLANIDNPEMANKFISDLILSESLRMRNRAKFINEQAEKGNRSTHKVRQQWNGYVENTPLIHVNPATKKPLFLNQWIEDNQGRGTHEEIIEAWRNYGK